MLLCEFDFERRYCGSVQVLIPDEVSERNCTLFNVIVFNNASSPMSNVAIVPVTSAVVGGATMSTDDSIYVVVNPGGVMVAPSSSTTTPHPTLGTVSRSVMVAPPSSTVVLVPTLKPSCTVPQSVVMKLLSYNKNSSMALAEIQKDRAFSIACLAGIGLIVFITLGLLSLIINIRHHFLKYVKANDSKKEKQKLEVRIPAMELHAEGIRHRNSPTFEQDMFQ